MATDAAAFDGDLFPEFTPTSTATWRDTLAADLGADWAERLRWDAGEGLTVRPFYRAEDLDGDVPTGAPGMEAGWQIRHDLASAEDPRRALHEALDRGADALGLPVERGNSEHLLRDLPADVNLAETALHLTGASPEDARRLFASADVDEPRGSLTFDPAARRFASDDFDADDGYRRLASLLRDEADRAPPFRLVTADARALHQAGAGPVASLALALASLSEHFARLTEERVAPETVARHAQVVLPVGTRFFIEVARLRAVRRLFAQLAEAYGADGDARLQVQAVTAWRATALYDPHLNLLRGATAGAAAAVTGGADVLAVRPHDAAQQNAPSDTGRRLALNAQHVLREEAHLSRAADPAAGSYYAEVLTDRLARRAWERFQHVEAGGGLLDELQRGAVQERLTEARGERQDALARRERVRVGTTHYPNLGEERLGDAPERSERPPRETDAFERLRLATERYARERGADRPAVFLLPVGTPRTRSARANFARNTLGCAGFRAVDSTGFDAAERGARAAADAVEAGDAQLVACAAPDDDYASLLPLLREALGERDAPVLAVARPDALPADERDAVAALLYRGMDLLGTLEALQKQLGITREG